MVAASAMLLAACSLEQVAPGPNVVARWKACGDSKDGMRNAGRTTLESTAWSEKTFIVKVKDNDYCAGRRITKPSYTLTGNVVQLSWTWELGPEKSMAACYCDFAVRFELSNLPAGNYQVQLARVR